MKLNIPTESECIVKRKMYTDKRRLVLENKTRKL